MVDLGYHKWRKFHRQTISHFLVFSAKVYMSGKFFKRCHPQMFMPVKFFKIGHPQSLNACKILKIFQNVVGKCSSYDKILESQVLQRDTKQSSHSNVFIFNIYICILSCLNTTCPPGHHHNGCITICAFGYTYVQLHVAGILKNLWRHL